MSRFFMQKYIVHMSVTSEPTVSDMRFDLQKLSSKRNGHPLIHFKPDLRNWIGIGAHASRSQSDTIILKRRGVIECARFQAKPISVKREIPLIQKQDRLGPRSCVKFSASTPGKCV